MKRVLNLTVASGVLLMGSSGSMVRSASDQDFLMPGFKPEEWTLASHSENKTQRVLEFVPPGQKVESWTELLTVQTLKKPRKPPAIDGLAASSYENLGQRCPGSVTSNVIARESGSERGGESILFEWSVKNCPPDADQHEVARLLYGKFSIFRVAYVAKTGALEPEKRDKWIAELSATKIVRD
jgi:hypothetical protein